MINKYARVEHVPTRVSLNWISSSAWKSKLRSIGEYRLGHWLGRKYWVSSDTLEAWVPGNQPTQLIPAQLWFYFMRLYCLLPTWLFNDWDVHGVLFLIGNFQACEVEVQLSFIWKSDAARCQLQYFKRVVNFNICQFLCMRQKSDHNVGQWSEWRIIAGKHRVGHIADSRSFTNVRFGI